MEIKFYVAFALNRRVDLYAIDATPARWRGDAGSSPLDRARTAASSQRAPTHWLSSTQVPPRGPVHGQADDGGNPRGRHAAGLHRPLRRRQRARRPPEAARCRGRRAAARARARRAHGRPRARPAAPQEEEGHAARPRHLPPLGRAHVTARPAGPVTRVGCLGRPARRHLPPIEPSRAVA